MEHCPREANVVEASRSGQLPVELAAHATACPVCAEALLVASFLAGHPGEAEVPAAGLVYWKAELRARREQAERAMRPMRTMEIAAMILLCLLAVGVGVLSGSVLLPVIGMGFGGALLAMAWVVKAFLLRDSQPNSTRSIARNS